MPKRGTTLFLICSLATMILPAKAELIIFGKDWTNSTGWVTSDVKWSSERKMNYFGKTGAFALSPEFPFAITSIVVTARNTNAENPRTLRITPISSGTHLTDSAWSFTPQADDSDLTAYTNGWPRDLAIDSLRIDAVSGAGNTYVEKTELDGPAFIDPPTSLSSPDPGAAHAKLFWENPGNAVSNHVTVYEITNREESYTPHLHYDFNSLTNTRSQTSLIDDFSERYPDFYGEQIRYPANCTGMVQISGSESTQKGFLAHHGHDPYSKLTLLLRAKRYNHAKEEKTMTIDWIDHSADVTVTNAIDKIELDLELQDFAVPLTRVEARKASIIFNAGGNKSNHRVIIDDIRFVKDYIAPSTLTNIVSELAVTARESIRVNGLKPQSVYFARVSATDARGKKSAPTAAVKFTTAKSDSLFIFIR